MHISQEEAFTNIFVTSYSIFSTNQFQNTANFLFQTLSQKREFDCHEWKSPQQMKLGS